MTRRVDLALPEFFRDGVEDRESSVADAGGSSGTVFEFVCYSLAQEFVHGVPIDLIQCQGRLGVGQSGHDLGRWLRYLQCHLTRFGGVDVLVHPFVRVVFSPEVRGQDASSRPLSGRERELVAESRRLRRQLYVRLGPKPLPAAKRVPHCARPAPAGGIRSVVSAGLPGTGKRR